MVEILDRSILLILPVYLVVTSISSPFAHEISDFVQDAKPLQSSWQVTEVVLVLALGFAFVWCDCHTVAHGVIGSMFPCLS